MSVEEASVQSLLDATLNANYNPDVLQLQPEELSGETITTPLQFYDRHIGSSYILRHVVILPSILQQLSKICDNALKEFFANNDKLAHSEHYLELDIPEVEFVDSHTIGTYYEMYIGSICGSYTSRLLLHPCLDTWDYVFGFTVDKDTFFMSEGHLCVQKHSSGHLVLSDDLKKGLSKSTKKLLEEIMDRYPRLATWHLFPMVDTFTTLFHNVTKNIEFNWEASHTSGFHIKTHLTPSPDAKTLSRKLYARSSFRIKRSTKAHLERKSVTKTRKNVTPPQSQERTYRPDFGHYLQHAWASAAVHDTTYIILNCGRYERIGIRHRASQTLYLSGVIDTVNIQNPHYRKLHIGLHIAILQDVLERKELADALMKTDRNSKKRSAESLEDSETLNPKRRRRAPSPPRPTDAHDPISKELVHRKLALVSLDYGAYCSPIPSSFIRIGESCVRDAPSEDTDWTKDPFCQKKYGGKEYFSLKLSAPLGDGAVGVAHPGQAEVKLESGKVLQKTLVFKLAFRPEQQEKLKTEFEMYCLMARIGGIEGVVTMHGLFYDPESGVMGLLMGDGGLSLRRRETQRIGKFAKQVTTTWQERKAFLSSLNSLHKAGIKHGDLRPDNLTIDSDGRVFIIDFDRADWPHGEDNLADEQECLQDLLHGKFYQRGYH